MMQSLELDKLFKAMSLAQAEFPTIGSNRKAYTNSYADHYTIMRQVYPILKNHGLMVIPWAGKIDGTQMIGARLGHESGQYIINSYEFIMDELLPQKDKKTHKAAGSLTYFKRYHVKDIIGVLLSDDPQDDDLQEQQSHDTVDTKCITEKQVTYIKKLIHDAGLSLQDVCHEYGVKDISMLPMSQGSELIKALTN